MLAVYGDDGVFISRGGLGGRGTGLAEAASLVSSQWLCNQSTWSDASLNLHSLFNVSFSLGMRPDPRQAPRA